jgi:hypothetical protein
MATENCTHHAFLYQSLEIFVDGYREKCAPCFLISKPWEVCRWLQRKVCTVLSHIKALRYLSMATEKRTHRAFSYQSLEIFVDGYSWKGGSKPNNVVGPRVPTSARWQFCYGQKLCRLHVKRETHALFDRWLTRSSKLCGIPNRPPPDDNSAIARNSAICILRGKNMLCLTDGWQEAQICVGFQIQSESYSSYWQNLRGLLQSLHPFTQQRCGNYEYECNWLFHHEIGCISSARGVLLSSRQ